VSRRSPAAYALFASAETLPTINLIAGAPIPLPTAGAVAATIPVAVIVASEDILIGAVTTFLEVLPPVGPPRR